MSTDLVPRSQTLDLLRRMEEAGAISSTHLDLSAQSDLDLARCEAIAWFLGDLHDMSKWCIADLMLQAEARFGEAAYQIAAATKRSPGTLANWCRVASRVPPSRRRGELSFSTHAEVAGLVLDEQRELLDRAVAEGWSSHDMREVVRERRELAAGERDPCGDVVEEAAKDLRAALRTCGLPDVDVLVEIRGGAFEYSVRIP